MSKCYKLSPSKSAELKRLSEYLKVVSDFQRLQIVCLLGREERCVCEIYKALELPQNLVSHHLKVLKEAGVVEARRDGTWMRYRLSEEKSISYYEKTLRKALKVAKGDL